MFICEARPAIRAFTLLEVLVAIAILGLGLTAILSAQTGLFASSRYAEHVSVSTGLLRCRMAEIELKLQKEGYPLMDATDQVGVCCGDDPVPGYTCKWKIEKIELPLPPTNTSLTSGLGAGPLGAIASVGQSNGAVLGDSPKLGDVSRLLAGAGAPLGAPPLGAPAPSSTDGFGTSFGGPTAPGGGPLGGGIPGGMAGGMMGGTSALAPMVMSLVYPSLKPMLEASIRKITVTVTWKEGEKERSVLAVQFVTNPQQGGLDPNAAAGLDALLGGGQGGLLGGGTKGGASSPAGGILGGGILGGGK